MNSAVLRDAPRPLPLKIPAAVATVVGRCLAKEPRERYQTASEVAAALETAQAALLGRNEPAEPPRPRWRLHAAWAAAVVLAALLVSLLRRDGGGAPPVNPRPVVVVMDSPLPGRVYDPTTSAAGGTNADDITDALSDLGVVIHKENMNAVWHREQQVLLQNPDLVVSHLSSLLDERPAKGSAEVRDHLLEIATNRLAQFFAYVAAANPRTQFLVYSRANFRRPEYAEWPRQLGARFPALRGRVHTLDMPVTPGEATFRHPKTALLIRERVKAILATR
jgi:hypothetical protein